MSLSGAKVRRIPEIGKFSRGSNGSEGCTSSELNVSPNRSGIQRSLKCIQQTFLEGLERISLDR